MIFLQMPLSHTLGKEQNKQLAPRSYATPRALSAQTIAFKWISIIPNRDTGIQKPLFGCNIFIHRKFDFTIK
jgi:hypothetical protein